METDVVVLGGGAAGLSAARETVRQGGRAVIVNDGPLGGDCTFTGCVPSKTVIEASRAGLDFGDAFDRARAVVERIAATESADRLEAEGITVVDGLGELRAGATAGGASGPAVAVDGTTIRAKGVVLALGSRPFVPPIPGIDDAAVLTTDTLWWLERRPASMAIVGGGAIGVELAQALAGLGVDVTVIEMAPRLLVREEPEAAAVVADALTTAGVKVMTGAGVTRITAMGDVRRLELSDGRTVDAERVLIAVGRRANGDRGGLAEAGVVLDERGNVVNDDDLSTSVEDVYVAGDLSGRLQFTHAADHMGRLAAANIVSRWSKVKAQRFRSEYIPWVTFTHPEVARIGLSEAEATAVDGAMVAMLPLEEHDRAIAADATDGYIKLIAGPRRVLGRAGGGRIIGATIVAPRAGEMIGEIALAVRTGAFVGRLAQTVHPYPSWSYGIAKAAAQFFTSIEGREARPPRAGTEPV